jgi:hypothetical protein
MLFYSRKELNCREMKVVFVYKNRLALNSEFDPAAKFLFCGKSLPVSAIG